MSNQYGADKIKGPTIIQDGLFDEDQKTYIDFGTYEYITKKALEGLNTPNIVRYPFTNQTGDLTINWQTDIPPGYTQTYYQLYGNYVEAFIYVNGIPMGQQYDWTYDGSNNVNVVTFHFGDTQSGYIRFG